MENRTSKYHRKSIRLKNYDYSQSGFYFITLCTWKHMHLFGEIDNDRMKINKYGALAEKEWFKTADIRSYINLHEFVVMPNHLHGIIEIDRRGTRQCALTRQCAHSRLSIERFGKPTLNSIPTIIRNYKAVVTKQAREIGNDSVIHVWQKNYFEHVIRNEESYLKIAEYINNNPKKWNEDKYFG